MGKDVILCCLCLDKNHFDVLKSQKWSHTCSTTKEQCMCECHLESGKEDLDVSELVTGLRASGLNVIVLD